MNKYSNRKLNRTRKPRKIIFLGILAIAVIIGGFFANEKLNLLPTISDYATNLPSSTTKINLASAQDDLKTKINGILKQYPDTNSSITIINVSSGKQSHFGSNDAFTAASTTKLITATYFLNQVEQGNVSLDQTIGDETASWQLQQLIQQSDNNAWLLLNNYLGLDNLQAYAQQMGITSYNASDNTIDSADLALLLQKLSQNQLLNSEHAQLLMSFMQNTNNEDLIPAGAPNGAQVYHKFGELDNLLHDAAIINYQNQTYIVVILTDSQTDIDYPQRVSFFHQITQAIFD